MATVAETFIKPQVFRPNQKAVYTVSNIEEADLHADLSGKINSGEDKPPS